MPQTKTTEQNKFRSNAFNHPSRRPFIRRRKPIYNNEIPENLKIVNNSINELEPIFSKIQNTNLLKERLQFQLEKETFRIKGEQENEYIVWKQREKEQGEFNRRELVKSISEINEKQKLYIQQLKDAQIKISFYEENLAEIEKKLSNDWETHFKDLYKNNFKSIGIIILVWNLIIWLLSKLNVFDAQLPTMIFVYLGVSALQIVSFYYGIIFLNKKAIFG